ncbi:hypothetical protein [Nocardioides aequoreus]|uniref:hypothetical protein n=1 Tax=Nocardioides aequoreus TaxID=397278 RepID=UPI0012F62BAA|nr:hypothetical protein [Nocardioides aequoreus]
MLLVTGCGGDSRSAPDPPHEVPTLRGLSPDDRERRDRRELTDGCEYDQRGIPACGVLLGAAYGGNQDPSAWERRMGQQLGVRRTYYGPEDAAYAAHVARADLTVGRVPWISFKTPYSWGEMAEGAGDEWIADITRRLALIDGPVWLAIHHEPENDGNIENWTAMQERLAPIVRAGAPNVAYTVILTGYHQVFGREEFAFDRLWPDTTIDLVGFDVYERYGTIRDGSQVVQETPFEDVYFPAFEKFAEEHDTAWGLGETGYADEAVPDLPDFVRRTYDGVREHGGVVVAYFNSVLNSTASWRLDEEKEAAFTTVLRDSPHL